MSPENYSRQSVIFADKTAGGGVEQQPDEIWGFNGRP
jgi:hypothetical protein